MAFDWLSFFNQYSVENEPERRHDWQSFDCPWCGGAHHMGINLKTGIYHCWHGHSGKSPQRLIAALLNCSYVEANRIVGSEETSFVRSDETFAVEGMRRLGYVVDTPLVRPDKLLLLEEFTEIRNSGLCRALVLPYLRSRGYDQRDVLWLADRYKLRFAPRGIFAYRIIIPVFVDGQLVTWTGRTVADSEPLRYKSLSSDSDRAASQGLPVATMNIKDALLDLDNIRYGGKLLVVAEGPFDAMRLSFFGEKSGIRATCLFGQTPSESQLSLLFELRHKYKNMALMLDPDAGLRSSFSLPEYLRMIRMPLPVGVKDPAELTEEQFWRIFG